MTDRVWSTDGVPALSRRALWEHVAGVAWIAVSVFSPGDDLSARVSTRTVGALEVSRISTQPQVVDRSAALTVRSPGDRTFLNLPLTAGTSASQDGRTAHLAAGDFAIVDGARPFELRFREPLRQISVSVPNELLAGRLPAGATGLRVASTGVGAVAAGAVRGLATLSGPLDRRAARDLSDRVLDLVALAYGGVTGPARRVPRALLHQAVVDAIERSLADPGLSPALVAGQLGISVRLLHQVMSERGPSFGRWVLERRLARARAELADPGSPLRTVRDVAAAHGFSDPSYFARVYGRRFGVAPMATRRQAQG